MCGACAGKRCKFESIGVCVIDAPRSWLIHVMDVRGVCGGALQVRLDRRGRHRLAASVALSRHG
jgi:hypothetical protein